jgi:hypothetical protein
LGRSIALSPRATLRVADSYLVIDRVTSSFAAARGESVDRPPLGTGGAPDGALAASGCSQSQKIELGKTPLWPAGGELKIQLR